MWPEGNPLGESSDIRPHRKKRAELGGGHLRGIGTEATEVAEATKATAVAQGCKTLSWPESMTTSLAI